MLYKAIERAHPGDVLVASVGDNYEGGYWGHLMSISAMARSVGGLAIDGCIRDSEEITKMGFPVFCRGFCIWGTTRALLGLINHPIFFGGVLVHPGDLILGDDDGMVVVEGKQCESVLEKAIKRKEAEGKKADQLRAGGSNVELNKLDKVFKSLGLVEE
jgi:4-hydroxy-4-methyl-2-oxoglutarate aldolase